MQTAVPMVEIWRGSFLESVHSGHAVVCAEGGDIVHSWGDPTQVILPRSSSKMIQGLPLILSGAAKEFSLISEHLALACASHQGARMHVECAENWLSYLDLSEPALRCGAQISSDDAYHAHMIRAGETPGQLHNNCSGKHVGFLTLAKHLGAGPEYIHPDHPVQLAVKDAWEHVTDEPVAGFGIDGCSAPNFASSLQGIARAMAHFAAAAEGSAEAQLHRAMAKHPELVAGEGRACTNLMRAMQGRVTIKTGAEGVFVAILPDQKLGVALKIVDGATRASECAMAAILVKLGALDANHPETRKYLDAPILNRRDIQTGWQRPAAALT